MLMIALAAISFIKGDLQLMSTPVVAIANTTGYWGSKGDKEYLDVPKDDSVRCLGHVRISSYKTYITFIESLNKDRKF